MSTLLVPVILMLLLVALAVAVVRTARADGYGHRPPPRSHLPSDDVRAPRAA